MISFLRCAGIAIGLMIGSLAQAAQTPPAITVFAAASLKESLDAVVKSWETRSGQIVHVSYAGTSVLAMQIERGAEADMLISADARWMDYLQTRSLIDATTRIDLLANRLVLIAPTTSTLAAFDLHCAACWRQALADRRLALAEITGVPAGRYAHEALSNLSLWPALSARTAQADNVRAAMNFVALDESPLGIVYATDARAEPRVRVLAEIPDRLHAPIVYPVAKLSRHDAARSEAFFVFLRDPVAERIFRQAGFSVLEAAGADVQL